MAYMNELESEAVCSTKGPVQKLAPVGMPYVTYGKAKELFS